MGSLIGVITTRNWFCGYRVALSGPITRQKWFKLSTDPHAGGESVLAVPQACPMRTAKPFVLPKVPTSRTTLVGRGVSPQMIRTAVAAGRLLRLRAGVFLDAAAWPDDARAQHLLRAAAEVEAFPGSVLSHQSAAAAWGLPHPGFVAWHDQPVSITRVGDLARARSGAATHHAGHLPAPHTCKDSDGRPVTAIARTGVDLATGLSLPDALVILDACCRKLCSELVAEPRRSDFANVALNTTAREMLEQAVPAHRPRALIAAIALADARRESAPESLSFGHFHLAGLPQPQCQPRIHTPTGTVYPDFYWAEQNLIGECDGAVKYGDASGYVLEKEREQALRDLNFRVVRWLAKEIMTSPRVVIDRVARALG